jgi:multisubunit Na+/H+ antiporter MnhC subunit
MGVFEYVSVLTSIVIGLGVAHLLQGMAAIVQHPGRRQTYWVHLLWVAFMFFQAIFFWWWEFALESLEQWTFQVYLFVLFYAIIIYLLCALLFPQDLEGYSGYEDYFMSRRAWFLGLLATFFLIDFWDTWLKGADYFVSLGLEYPIAQGLICVGCVIGIATANRRFHAGFAILVLVYEVSFAVRTYGVIG